MSKIHFALSAVSACLLSQAIAVTVSAKEFIPANVTHSCYIAKSELETWSGGKALRPDSVFTPADSVTFDDATVCNFYKWSWQMFLWLTSADSRYGAAEDLVFDGQLFFDVDANSGKIFAQDSDVGLLRGGKSVSTEQAGSPSGVLLAQDGSLVYYTVHINNVYDAMTRLQAKYASGPASASGALFDEFPTTQKQLDALAAAAGVTAFAEGQALTMETKVSWVEIDKRDKDKYLTMMASIPDYRKSAAKPDDIWIWDGKTQRQALLGLVGFHVVSPVKGHPELVWATFEHSDNSPNNGFYYTPTDSGTPVLYSSFNDQGTLDNAMTFFAKGGAQGAANSQMASQCSQDSAHKYKVAACIQAEAGENIAPSDTFREYAWGSSPGLDGLDNNNDVLSANLGVQQNLAKGDVRKNYSLIGGIWTNDGSIPTYSSALYDPHLRGSVHLANSTLETYTQNDNCFSCHALSESSDIAYPANPGTKISHIYGEIVDYYQSQP
ncbi:hypothetical protein [Shewanella salipaludis]|uniref:Cytochrome c family protein n=1 Tax=Shewanella salipaludis TaxID=2723052 RepID=A0A972JLV5_9GAMM|nr:hypothetical protein [Shewanella salipaludis]NMH66594.1 hypothetical protein [Shewanella salipaludis]